VALEGRLQIREYTGRDGQKKTMAEVVVDNMQMLGKREESRVAGHESPVESGPETRDPRPETNEADEIPF